MRSRRQDHVGVLVSSQSNRTLVESRPEILRLRWWVRRVEGGGGESSSFDGEVAEPNDGLVDG